MPARGRPKLDRVLTGTFRWILRLLAAGAVANLGLFTLWLARVRPQAEDALYTARAVRRAHLAMVDQQTGLRGYLATGSARFLEPYEAGQAVLAETRAEAQRLLGNSRDVNSAFLEWRIAQARWEDGWARRAARGDVGELDLADDKALFDAYRDTYTPLERLLERRRDDLIEQQAHLAAITGAGALLSLVVLAVYVVRQRQRVTRLVVAPVAELLDVMGRVRAGDLGARAAAADTVEFTELADGLGSMTDALAEQLALADARTAEIVQRNENLGQILTMAREIGSSLSLHYVREAVAANACAIAGTTVAVWTVDDAAGEVVSTARADSVGVEHGAEQVVPLGVGVVGRAASEGRPVREVGAVAMPMIVGGRVVAVLEIGAGAALTSEQLGMLEVLCVHAGAAIEAARLHSVSEELAQVDPLTRLLNRRRLQGDLDAEVNRAHRYRRPLSLILVDIDHFKRVNDEYGHQRGDEVLQSVAAVLADSVRSSDTVYRYGGEELVVLSRESSLEDASALAERQRARIESQFAAGAPAVTASFGVATLTPTITTASALVAAADRMLYEAKRAGRNRVVTLTLSDEDRSLLGGSVASN